MRIQPLMFVFLFAFVLAGQLAGSRSAYLQYALPGLIVQSAVLVSARTAIGVNSDVTNGLFDRLRSLPISQVAPLLGRMLSDFVMLLWSVGILLGVGTLLGFRVRTSWVQLIPVLALLLVFECSPSPGRGCTWAWWRPPRRACRRSRSG